jgi:hypothetical protein
MSDYPLLYLEVDLAAGNTDIISAFVESKVVVEKVTCLKEKKAKAETINWDIILSLK